MMVWLSTCPVGVRDLSFFKVEIVNWYECINYGIISWWRHQIETFSVLLAFWEGNSPVTGGFPSQGPVTQSFDVFFDLRLNKHLSTQSRSWWFETPSHSLWRYCNVSMPCVVFSAMGLNFNGQSTFRSTGNVQRINRPRIAFTLTSHGGHDVSKHRQLDCLFNSSLMLTATEKSKLRITAPL